jgi:hypothetical protein
MALSDYITSTYGQLKTQLSWGDSTQILTITNKTLQLYGVTLEVDATDIAKLEALCDYAVWRQALADISLDYAFSADGSSFSRNQAVEQVRQNMLIAENAALPYLPNYEITIHEDKTNADWWEAADA